MKKLFLTVAIALGTLTAVNAQEVGQMWVGGSVAFESSKVKGGDSEISFKVLPEFGYVFTENLGVGIAIGAGHQHYGLDGEVKGLDLGTGVGKDSENYYVVNPFLRYTFLKGGIGSLFADGGLTYAWSRGDGEHNHMWQAGIKPGVALNVSDKVSLLGKFGFLGYESTKSATRSFGFNFDMSNIEIGMNLKF